MFGSSWALSVIDERGKREKLGRMCKVVHLPCFG